MRRSSPASTPRPSGGLWPALTRTASTARVRSQDAVGAEQDKCVSRLLTTPPPSGTAKSRERPGCQETPRCSSATHPERGPVALAKAAGRPAQSLKVVLGSIYGGTGPSTCLKSLTVPVSHDGDRDESQGSHTCLGSVDGSLWSNQLRPGSSAGSSTSRTAREGKLPSTAVLGVVGAVHSPIVDSPGPRLTGEGEGSRRCSVGPTAAGS